MTVLSRRGLLRAGFGLAAVVAVEACSSGSKGKSAAEQAATPITIAPGDTVSLSQIEAKPTVPPEKVPKSVAMVGDSITALSQTVLDVVLKNMGFAEVTINAEPSRRIEVGSQKPMPGLDVIKYIAAASPPEMWVVALGTNDAGLYATDDEYRGLIGDVLAVIPAEAPLVWVSVYRHDQLDGCDRFNALLRESLQSRGNASVAEWNQQCTRSEQSILTDDGVHPNPNGILVFADTVRAGIAAELS